MRENLIKLGTVIKSRRKECGMTLQEVADRTGLTSGLLSKVENFRAIPSLPVLLKIAAALRISAAELLEGIDGNGPGRWLLVRKQERRDVERENSRGMHYQSLLDTASSGIHLQAMVLTIEPGAVRERVTTEGDQFILILQGRIDYLLDRERLTLEEGDSLFFDGNIPHVPENPSAEPAVLLAIYLLKEKTGE